MSRKVYLEVKLNIIVNADETVSMDNLISEIEIDPNHELVDIVDVQISEWQLMDSK